MILNSMVADLSNAILYADSAYELWKEICERYGQSNGPLIYQNEWELSNVVQGNLSMGTYFNKMKKFWDQLHNLNGMPVCTCGQMNTCTCGILDKFFEMESRSKLMQFLMKLNDDFKYAISQIFSIDHLPNVNKAYYIVQQVEKQKQVTTTFHEPTAFYAKNTQYNKKENKGGNRNDKRFCTNCQQDGHTNDQCFEKIGYPDWYKEKKNNKKSFRMVANVYGEFDKGMHQDTPFDMEFENGINVGQHGKLDQRMVAVVCQEVMKIFKGKNVAQEASTSYHACIKFCGYSYALSYKYTITMKFSWIVDIRASDHMSPHIDIGRYCALGTVHFILGRVDLIFGRSLKDFLKLVDSLDLDGEKWGKETYYRAAGGKPLHKSILIFPSAQNAKRKLPKTETFAFRERTGSPSPRPTYKALETTLGRLKYGLHGQSHTEMNGKGEEERSNMTKVTHDNTEKPTETEAEMLVKEAETKKYE
ncbi:hypothetical protein Tco_0963962 [Tanacetum coccineum]